MGKTINRDSCYLLDSLYLPPLRCGVGFCRRMCGVDTQPDRSRRPGHWTVHQPQSGLQSVSGCTQHVPNLKVKVKFNHRYNIDLYRLYVPFLGRGYIKFILETIHSTGVSHKVPSRHLYIARFLSKRSYLTKRDLIWDICEDNKLAHTCVNQNKGYKLLSVTNLMDELKF